METGPATVGMDRLQGQIDHMVFLHVDSELLLAIGHSQGVQLVDAATRAQVDGPDRRTPVTALAALPHREHGDLLLVGGADGLVWQWDPRTLADEPPLRCGPGEVRDFAVGTDHDGGEVVVIARDTGVCLWRPGGTEFIELATIPAEHGELPFKVTAFTHQGRHYAACALTNGNLAVWDLATPQVTPLVSAAHEGPIWSIISMPDRDGGSLVATGGSDQMLRILAPTADGGLGILRSYATGGTIRRLGHVLADGAAMIATASARGAVSLWRYDGGIDTAAIVVTQHAGEVYALACDTADEAVVVASGDFNGNFQVTRMTGRVLSPPRPVRQIEGTIWAVSAGSTVAGEFYAFAGVTRTVHLVHPFSGADISRLVGHQSTVRAVAFAGTAADPHLISCGADHSVIDWDPAESRQRAILRTGHKAEVWAVTTVAHRGRWYAVTGGPDGTVRRIALDRPDESEIVLADCGEVQSLATVTRDGQVFVVIGSTQGLLRVPLFGGAVHAVAATPFGAVTIAPDTRPLVVAARADGVVELYDVFASVLVTRFDMPLTGRQVRALAAHRTDSGYVLIFGGCDNGAVLKWGLDGHLIGEPALGGDTSIRAMAVARHGSGPGSTAVLLTGGHDGILRAWTIARDKPLSTGGELTAPMSAAAILLSDQPTAADGLAREALTKTVVEALSNTTPPIVVGIHAPWGQGKSSLLQMIRRSVDPVAADAADAKKRGEPAPVRPTHRLFHRDGDREVTEDITPSWAWSRLQQRMRERSFPYVMRPDTPDRKIISVWFNPWMYERPEQIWAGLTHEILTAVTERLPDHQRRTLYFDLNLKRTGAEAMRKQIMLSLRPRTIRGVAVMFAGLLALVAAIVGVVVAVVNTGQLDKIFGTAAVIILAALAAVARIVWIAVKGFGSWYDPAAVRGPSSGGVLGLLNNSSDPLETPERGYLYLLQHDVREVIDLVTENSALYIFVDDMDRCGPAIVADTVEAINLFLTNALGPCVFVIAMDPSTVAAHLESDLATIGQRAKEDPASFGHLQHTGWRFMEKIVDLPIRLPRAPDVAIVNYLEQLLLSDQRQAADALNAAAVSAPPDPVVPAQRSAETRRSWRGRPVAAPDPVVPIAAPEPAPPPLRTEPTMLAGGVEAIPAVRAALHEAVRNLPARNPRQVKTFINLWRFYMVLEYQLGVTTTSLTGTQQHSAEMARIVEIMVRWPWLLDMLGKRYIASGEPTIVLDHLYGAAADTDEVWTTAVESFYLSAIDADTVALREVFLRPGTDRKQLIAIATRYL